MRNLLRAHWVKFKMQKDYVVQELERMERFASLVQQMPDVVPGALQVLQSPPIVPAEEKSLSVLMAMVRLDNSAQKEEFLVFSRVIVIVIRFGYHFSYKRIRKISIPEIPIKFYLRFYSINRTIPRIVHSWY
jgi:hypothetical protein